MAGISYNTPIEGVSLAWVGDELRQRDRVMVTGGLLNAADFALTADGRRYAESGTLVGRTYAERNAGAGFGPVAIDAGGNVTDNEVYLLLHDVYNAARDASATFYRPGSLVYDELLPAASQTANQLAAVRRFYQTQRRP